jgi:hypothetical protein
MTNSTTGRMSLLAAVSLMAVTVGMAAPAQAADTTAPGSDSACAKNAQGESIFIKGKSDHSCTQIKGQSNFIKVQTDRGSTQVKGEATHIKIDNSGQNKVVSPRDPASGLPTGR